MPMQNERNEERIIHMLIAPIMLRNKEHSIEIMSPELFSKWSTPSTCFCRLTTKRILDYSLSDDFENVFNL